MWVEDDGTGWVWVRGAASMTTLGCVGRGTLGTGWVRVRGAASMTILGYVGRGRWDGVGKGFGRRVDDYRTRRAGEIQRRITVSPGTAEAQRAELG